MSINISRVLYQLLLVVYLTTISVVMNKAVSFTFKMQPNNELSKNIQRFWQTGKFSSFQGVDNIRINYAKFVVNSDFPCLIISPGRSEGYLKYQELIYDLSLQSVNIFIIDHRGQGLSGRMQNNANKGYVDKFDDYAEDLHTFITTIVQPNCKSSYKPLLLGHSMGGAIALRLMQTYPNTIKSALLSSPMIAINAGGIPQWLAATLINSGQFINQLTAEQSWYFFGQGDYATPSFDKNVLTHSAERYKRFVDLYQRTPELQLGGVTFSWLQQALQANKDIFNDIDKIATPITIIQAGADSVVSNDAQNTFCQRLSQRSPAICNDGYPIVIEDAYHELFFEQDEYRDQALAAVSKWIEQYR